jgi:hypothetical protein
MIWYYDHFSRLKNNLTKFVHIKKMWSNWKKYKDFLLWKNHVAKDFIQKSLYEKVKMTLKGTLILESFFNVGLFDCDLRHG